MPNAAFTAMHLGLSAFPIHQTALPDGSVVNFRQARANIEKSDSTTLVLMHGIGSNSASWLPQLQHGLNAGLLLAWNAPGYGQGALSVSTPLLPARPVARDYASRLWDWLDALKVRNVHLVGHSLGAIMAANASCLQPERVQSLTLLSPAQGYATASDSERENKRSERLENLRNLGVQGLADKRGAAMLSPQADARTLAYAKYLMAHINVPGYTQAVHLLMDADLASDLAQIPQLNTRIACGTADTITPPAGCAALAARFNIPYTPIPNAGHSVAIDAPDAINHFLSV